MKKRYSAALLLVFFLCLSQLTAQQLDQVYNQKIKDFTTDKRFLPQSLLDLVDHPSIPSPLKHFGHIIGA